MHIKRWLFLFLFLIVCQAQAASNFTVLYYFDQVPFYGTGGKSNKVDIQPLFSVTSTPTGTNYTFLAGAQNTRYWTDTNAFLGLTNLLQPGFGYRVTYYTYADPYFGNTNFVVTNVFPASLTNGEVVNAANPLYFAVPNTNVNATTTAYSRAAADAKFMTNAPTDTNAGYVLTKTTNGGVIGYDWEAPQGGSANALTNATAGSNATVSVVSGVVTVSADVSHAEVTSAAAAAQAAAIAATTVPKTNFALTIYQLSVSNLTATVSDEPGLTNSNYFLKSSSGNALTWTNLNGFYIWHHDPWIESQGLTNCVGTITAGTTNLLYYADYLDGNYLIGDGAHFPPNIGFLGYQTTTSNTFSLQTNLPYLRDGALYVDWRTPFNPQPGIPSYPNLAIAGVYATNGQTISIYPGIYTNTLTPIQEKQILISIPAGVKIFGNNSQNYFNPSPNTSESTIVSFFGDGEFRDFYGTNVVIQVNNSTNFFAQNLKTFGRVDAFHCSSIPGTVLIENCAFASYGDNIILQAAGTNASFTLKNVAAYASTIASPNYAPATTIIFYGGVGNVLTVNGGYFQVTNTSGAQASCLRLDTATNGTVFLYGPTLIHDATASAIYNPHNITLVGWYYDNGNLVTVGTNIYVGNGSGLTNLSASSITGIFPQYPTAKIAVNVPGANQIYATDGNTNRVTTNAIPSGVTVPASQLTGTVPNGNLPTQYTNLSQYGSMSIMALHPYDNALLVQNTSNSVTYVARILNGEGQGINVASNGVLNLSTNLNVGGSATFTGPVTLNAPVTQQGGATFGGGVTNAANSSTNFLFMSGTNCYIGVTTTNAAGTAFTTTYMLGNNISGNALRIVGTNSTDLLKLDQAGIMTVGTNSLVLSNNSIRVGSGNLVLMGSSGNSVQIAGSGNLLVTTLTSGAMNLADSFGWKFGGGDATHPVQISTSGLAVGFASGGASIPIGSVVASSTGTFTNGVVYPPKTTGPTWAQIGSSNSVVMWCSNSIPPTEWHSYFNEASNRVDYYHNP